MINPCCYHFDECLKIYEKANAKGNVYVVKAELYRIQRQSLPLII